MRFLLALVIILSCPGVTASTEVFFSPDGRAKDRLISAIRSARNSLDVASFRFTSVDIAEALLDAKNRGVRVRLLADEKESRTKQSVIANLREEGLNVKYIKERLGGKMDLRFILFDSAAVFTGSYNLTEDSNKFNYENAVFTDDPQLVSKYQAQFNKLYGEPSTTKPALRKEVAAKEKGQRRFIGLSLSHLGRLLGKDSMLPDSEKKMIWSHCKGYYVRGEGEIVSASVNSAGEPTVVIRDTDGTEVHILLDAAEADKITKTSGGEFVSYTGRLAAQPGAADNSFRLDRGSLK